MFSHPYQGTNAATTAPLSNLAVAVIEASPDRSNQTTCGRQFVIYKKIGARITSLTSLRRFFVRVRYKHFYGLS
jgi:hypothetical protein